MPARIDLIGRLPRESRVAVIRLRSLGDCVLTTPAIRLLKMARPDLDIAVVAEERFAPVFENHPDIARILAPRISAIRAFSPALCLNLHGGTRSAWLTLFSGARFRAGFDIFRPPWIYNVRIPIAQHVLGIPRRVHTAEHMACAMFFLGVPVCEVPRAHIEVPAGRSANHPGRPYAIVHPLGASPEKTWPAESFLRLADHLSRVMDLEPIFIAGAGEDLSAFKTWRTVTGAPIPEVAKLMRDASLFAGVDSGPAHVAAAFGIPQVVIFGPSDSEVWAPWRTPAEILKAHGPIQTISPEEAIRAVGRLANPIDNKDKIRTEYTGAGR